MIKKFDFKDLIKFLIENKKKKNRLKWNKKNSDKKNNNK